MRKKMIAGNWKMNMTPSGAVSLAAQLKPMVDTDKADVVFCVPAIDILPVAEEVKDSNIKVGAQNMYYEEKGAYTGEISPAMLTDAGVSYVIIGHSERRQYFKEDDAVINKKVKKALEHNIIPILCCGESLEQREAGVTLDFVREQITQAFSNIAAEDAVKCIIAYEPIWAIGTGKVATSQQAQEVCQAIRDNIRDMYNASVADNIRILYGGSVNAANASEIFAQPDIDGGLVGGASLKPDFADIVNYK